MTERRSTEYDIRIFSLVAILYLIYMLRDVDIQQDLEY